MSNKVLIIGDAMLDTYIYGKVGRISPEAPVPVIESFKIMQCLGGAGNVARNAVALGSEVSVIFTFGMDQDGDSLHEMLKEWGINCQYLLRSYSLKTINKTRVVGNDQQIARIDYNDSYSLTTEMEERIFQFLKEAIPKNDIIIISDYGKGTCSKTVCNKVIELSGRKPVIVDPKGIDWEKYRGASVITPNLKEANTFSSKEVKNNSEAVEKEYGNLTERIGIKYLLLTRSEEGMSLLSSRLTYHISAYSHEVYDVSGAGDTVVAALASYVHSGLDNIIEAARIANIAAGLVVAKPGTAVVTKDEIQQQMALDDFCRPESKIYSLKDYDKVKKLVSFWRTAGNKIVTANGCFDILHRGHIKLLREAKSLGDKLIVAINSDASVKRLKGEERPVNSEMDRAYVISSIDAVDAVIIFDPFEMPVILDEQELSLMSEKAQKTYSEAPMALMKMIMPDVHIKGGDYKKEDIPEAIYAECLAIVGTEEGYSTTNVINKMCSVKEL